MSHRLLSRALPVARALVVVVAVPLAAACGEGDEPDVATGETSAAAPDQPAAPATDADAAPVETDESASDPAPAAVAPVAFERLVERLPDVPGWTRNDARGERLAVPMAYARAEAEYRRGNGRIELEIVDSGRSEVLLAPLEVFLGSGFSERWTGGSRRATRIAGDPGFEEWNVDAGQGEVTRLVRDRYIVRAFGYDLDDLEPVRTLVAAVPLGGLPGVP